MTFRGAVLEKTGAEEGSQNVQAFDAGDEHSETFERVPDGRASIAQSDRGDRGVGDLSQGSQRELLGCIQRITCKQAFRSLM